MSLNYKLEALYHFSGNVTDSSGNGNDGTNNNVTFVADKNGNTNSAGSFNGTDSYVDTNYTGAALGTYSCWVKTTTTSRGWIVGARDNGTQVRRIDIRANFDGSSTNSGYLYLEMHDSSGNSQAKITSSSTNFNDGNWHHLVVIFESQNIKFYIDKEEISLTNDLNQTMTNFNFVVTPYIGAFNDNPTALELFDGTIDEVRIYSRALTETEVTQLFVGYDTEKNQVGTLNHGLVFGSHFNSGGATDWTGNGNDGTVNGATATTDKNGNPDSALSFDGVDDEITIPEPYAIGTGEVSLSIWINSNDVNDNTKIILHNKDGSSNNNNRIFMRFDTGNLQMFVRDSANNNILSTTTFSINTWYHIVWTRSGSNQNLYVNGILDNSSTAPSGDIGLSGFDWTLGNLNTGLSNFFWSGEIDEFAIYDRKLSPVEALMLYKGYDSEQNSQDTFDIDLVAGHHFSGNASDFSGNGNTLTLVGDASVTATDKNGNLNSALTLDNNGDYGKHPIDLLDTSKSYSVLGWFYSSSWEAGDTMFFANLNNSNGFYFYYNSTPAIRFNTAGTNLDVPKTLPNSEWFVLCGTYRDYDNLKKIYFNEEFLGTANHNSNQGETSLQIGAYRENSNYLGGDVDEPRIYQRDVTDDEVIEYTYGYDEPTMLDDDLVGGSGVVITENSPFLGGGI